VRVDDGTRTHDRLDHNQELYQLSYVHQDGMESSAPSARSSEARYPGPTDRNDFPGIVMAPEAGVGQE
jgi:hypothetical protein